MTAPTKLIRVGMWGGPGSGMTTFLAAARTAAAAATRPVRWRRAGTAGSWAGVHGSPALAGCRVDGDEVPAHLEAGYFPPRSVGDATDYTWRITGQRREGSFDFRVTVTDRPGEHFLRDSRQSLRDYGDCQAFVHLLDLTDPRKLAPLAALPKLLGTLGARGHVKLAQHVVVCLAKYDDPRVFGGLRDHLIADNMADPNLYLHSPLPRNVEHVVRTHARGVAEELERYFHHDRIHYFATSSVGFLRLGDRKVHLDCQPNVVLVGGRPMVASELHPVNVLEPFVLLHDKIG